MNAIRHTILGLFFFGTLIALGVVTIWLGDFHPMGEPTRLAAYFEDVDALGPGDPVLLFGVQAGRVDAVEFTDGEADPARRLRVEFTVNRPLTLRQGYSIAIGSPSLLGGKQLDVMTGDGAPLAPSEYADLRGRADANLVRQLVGILGDNRADVRSIIRTLESIVAGLDSGERSLLGLILERPAHDDVNAAIAGARSVVEKADRGEGSIGRALNSPELHDRAAGFFDSGEKLLTDAREQPGVIHSAIYDEEMARRLKSGVEGLADAAERVGRGEGLLGILTQAESESAWHDFRSVAADGRALLADVRAGRGAVGKLFSDPETEQRLVAIVSRFGGIADDVAILAEGARRGRGVIGWLFVDDEARRTVERIVDQLDRALEDAREAAPVSSVASFLFGQL